MRFDWQSAAGKAFGPNPVWFDRQTPVVTYVPGQGSNQSKQSQLSQREARLHMEAYGGQEAVDWVYDAMGLYSDTLGSAEWHLEKEDGTKLVRHKTKLTPDEYDVGPKDLYDLLDQPNPFTDYTEQMELLTIDLLLVGNAYWLKFRPNEKGQPMALYRMSPQYIKVETGPAGVTKYIYNPPGAQKPLKYSPDDVMHFRLANPNNAAYGMGKIRGGGRMLDIELSLTDRMASYYENAAEPSLIVQSERRIPRDVWNKLRAQLRARSAGTKNAGELLALESGLKAMTLSPSASDALFAEVAKLSRDRILGMFRASPLLFGILDENSGSNKVADVRREFDTYTIRPFMDRIQKRITAWLAASWGCKFVIDYRYVMPLEDLLKQGESLAKVPGIKVREVRRFYGPAGIEESTGDKEIDELILNMPTPEADENGMSVDPQTGQKVRSDANGADRPLGSEAGRPPKGENTRTFKTPAAGARGPVRQGKALGGYEYLGDGTWARREPDKPFSMDDILDRISYAEKAVVVEEPKPVRIGTKLPNEQRPVDAGSNLRDSDVSSASNLINGSLQDAAHVLERALLDHVEGKAFKPDDLAKRIRESTIWGSFSDLIADAIIDGGVRAASSAAGAMSEAGFRPSDDLNYERIAQSIAARPDGADAIASTLKKSILDKVAEAVKAEKTADEVEALVREAVTEWRTGKADVIATTEAVHAYNETTLRIAEDSGVTEVMVSDGHDHDAECQDADGRVWDIGYARDHRIEHPNCRRAFLPLVR